MSQSYASSVTKKDWNLRKNICGHRGKECHIFPPVNMYIVLQKFFSHSLFLIILFSVYDIMNNILPFLVLGPYWYFLGGEGGGGVV
jgi:hypothetical protein